MTAKKPGAMRVAWLVVNHDGSMWGAFKTRGNATAWKYGYGCLGQRIVRVTYQWPPVSRAKRGEK